jgi:putative effector of murein hydrolase LrgA (UPF0299 family)
MELAGAAGLATLVTILLAACLATLILMFVAGWLGDMALRAKGYLPKGAA